MSGQPWYQGGYRANIVAYTIAKVAHDVENRARAVDFEAIWRRQTQAGNLDDAVAIAAKQVYTVLVKPPDGISNVTEWAKKQACWERVRTLDIALPDAFYEGLVSVQEQQDAARTARREQRELNGIEAQIAVVNAGGPFWSDTLAWGRARRLLTPTEESILSVAARIPTRLPTEKQSSKTIEIFGKLQAEGYSERLPT